MAADIRMRTRSTDKISKAAKVLKLEELAGMQDLDLFTLTLAHLGLGLRSSKIKPLSYQSH